MHNEGAIELEEPQLTDEGIAFVVRVEHSGRPCLVTREALDRLCRDTGFAMDPMNVYRAFEARINSVARRKVFTGADASPIVLGPRCFH